MPKPFEIPTDAVPFALIRARVTPDVVDADAERFTGVGFSIVDGQLAIAIMDATTGRTLSACIHGDDLDRFCGLFSDYLIEVSPVAADARLGAEPWPSLQ